MIIRPSCCPGSSSCRCLDIIAIAVGGVAIDTIAVNVARRRFGLPPPRGWIVQIVSLSPQLHPFGSNDSQNTSLQKRNHCCIYKAAREGCRAIKLLETVMVVVTMVVAATLLSDFDFVA
jgi:hypothetical protein